MTTSPWLAGLPVPTHATVDECPSALSPPSCPLMGIHGATS